MGVLKKMIMVLIVVLITSVLWVGLVIYLNYSSVELRTELLRSPNIYAFLSKGMLDEVKIVVEDDEGVPIEGSAPDFLEPIESYFSKVGFEKVIEKIEENLIVPPSDFHQLQNDAVIRETAISN